MAVAAAVAAVSPCLSPRSSLRSSACRARLPLRSPRCAANAGGGELHEGDQPYSASDHEIVTLFTADGVVRLAGRKIRQARNSSSSQHAGFPEKTYVSLPGLCVGATFGIHATNGQDMRRRICIVGFCHSVEMLSDEVEQAVLNVGGEVWNHELESLGLHEKLHMTVAVPLLWGVPPALDSLRDAIRTGGGVVHHAYRQWAFL
eukprot:jgi/Chlat1/6717/Chrsp50S06424